MKIFIHIINSYDKWKMFRLLFEFSVHSKVKMSDSGGEDVFFL